jgi:hypothetical protein
MSGFYEDERIRNKNRPKSSKEAPQPMSLYLGDKVSLAEVLEKLKEAKFKVTLQGNNTVVIE